MNLQKNQMEQIILGVSELSSSVAFQHSNGLPSQIHNLKHQPNLELKKKKKKATLDLVRHHLWRGVPESHFSIEHLPKYLLPKIVAVTAAQLSEPGEFNYSKKGLTKVLPCWQAAAAESNSPAMLPSAEKSFHPQSQLFRNEEGGKRHSLIFLIACFAAKFDWVAPL